MVFFDQMTTKQKLFANMLLSQIGFGIISAVAILSHSAIVAIIAVNLIFAIIVAYTNWAAMIRITKGIENFKTYIDEIINFTFMRTNKINKVAHNCNDEIGLVIQELHKKVDQIDKLRKEDMQVLGEVVLVMDKISQGIYRCRVKSNSKNFMINALRKSVNTMLDNTSENIYSLKNTLEYYAKDNYTEKININPRIKEDMLLVMGSINSLGEVLRKNGQRDLENGQTLEINATNMTQSVSNVAYRANKQATSLQETAVAVEKITKITRDNTQNAITMAQLGNTVKDSVSKGQNLATKTAQAMENINTQVSNINEAISIIDQIAFQTNILSLNAAVEAATAGEAGKGFAVVAQEVRNLANRSSDAAKQIQDLVVNATTTANEGKSISDEMMRGYIELNGHIAQTITIIENVSSASKEQMRGIEQINSTISTLETVTQSNASEADNVAHIANQTMDIAKKLVEDARGKKF